MKIRIANSSELKYIGEMMIQSYSSLEGFPKEEEMPAYYDMIRNVGDLQLNENIDIYVSELENEIAGAVVFIKDMGDYGSGGIATSILNASGFRLLTVSLKHQGKGIGKSLVNFCISKGKEIEVEQLIIHTTKPMKQAWGMYRKMGFKRNESLDFMHDNIDVFGFSFYY